MLDKNAYKVAFDKGYTYDEYTTLVKDLFEQNKNTGTNHSEEYLNYTNLNIRRMARIDKKGMLLPETEAIMRSIVQSMKWLVLTEGWCADAAQIIPYFAKMANLNSNIELRLILRDEHLDIMNAHLYNGTLSIPKLICLDGVTLDILGDWGPRPKVAQRIVEQVKLDKSKTNDAALKAALDYEKNKALQFWYKNDKGISSQKEFIQQLGLGQRAI